MRGACSLHSNIFTWWVRVVHVYIDMGSWYLVTNSRGGYEKSSTDDWISQRVLYVAEYPRWYDPLRLISAALYTIFTHSGRGLFSLWVCVCIAKKKKEPVLKGNKTGFFCGIWKGGTYFEGGSSLPTPFWRGTKWGSLWLIRNGESTIFLKWSPVVLTMSIAALKLFLKTLYTFLLPTKRVMKHFFCWGSIDSRRFMRESSLARLANPFTGGQRVRSLLLSWKV